VATTAVSCCKASATGALFETIDIVDVSETMAARVETRMQEVFLELAI
jgi:hypothetical protein